MAQEDFVIESGTLIQYEGSGGNVTIPDGVTSIGKAAFYGCNSLTSVTIGNGVKSIGSGAFHGCKSLASITIGNGVKSIGGGAFHGCKSLASITVDPGNTVYHSEGNCIIETKNKTLIVGCMNSVIPSDDSVTHIGTGAFSGCSSLTSITIPNSVTSIGDGAFSYCSSLTSVTIPDSVTEIGEGAFYGCRSLTSITIGNGVTSIGYEAFSGCSSLTSVTIPDSVTSIGDRAFEECKSLTSVTIGNSVTSIGDRAFSGCKSLTSVTIGNGVTSIGDGAFEECKSLMKIRLSASFCDNFSMKDAWITDDVIRVLMTHFADIPENGQKVLSDYIKPKKTRQKYFAAWKDPKYADAFIALLQLQKKLPIDEIDELLESVGSNNVVVTAAILEYKHRLYSTDDVEKHETEKLEKAFGIRELSVADWKQIFRYSVKDGCITISGYKSTDAVVEIPDKIGKCPVTLINDMAFRDCKFITSVTIPDSVTSIGYDAFSGCESLTSVTIPDGVKSIGDRTFYNCSSLTSVTIPDSVTSIGGDAFSGCESLTSITIPDSVTSIGDRAFSRCSSLAYTEYDNARYLGNSINPYLFLIEATSRSVTSCTIHENTKCICDKAFRDCSSLASVTIPDSVTEIGWGTFSYCSSLTSITIGDSVKSIDYHTFAGCESLTVYAPDGSYAAEYAKKNGIPVSFI